MGKSGGGREIPGWVAAVAVGIIVVVLVIVGVTMFRPAPTANKVTVIGPGNSAQSYLSHYGTPPAGSPYSAVGKPATSGH